MTHQIEFVFFLRGQHLFVLYAVADQCARVYVVTLTQTMPVTADGNIALVGLYASICWLKALYLQGGPKK